MEICRSVASDVFWLGESDRRLERFENMHPLTDGMSYNAYFIDDEKTALLDTVDYAVAQEFFMRLDKILAGRQLDYLVVHHAEPDHAAMIGEVCRRYPNVRVVGNAKTFSLIRQFDGVGIPFTEQPVADGGELCLGRHTLRFIYTPMVHWPEVMMSYDQTDGILFSADAFGTFGALSGNIFADETAYEERFMAEARRYYANIVGKYGAQVQAAFKKLPIASIKIICPLHGPIWRRELERILDKYRTWSEYAPEEKGVVIAYGSMYGNTRNAVSLLAEALAEKGVRCIAMHDVSKRHASYIIGDIFRYSHLVLAAPTYNNGLYLPMQNLLHDMAALNIQNRRVALIGNGSWAPASHRLMAEQLAAMKGLEVVGVPIVLKSALAPEQLADIEALAQLIAAEVEGDGGM